MGRKGVAKVARKQLQRRLEQTQRKLRVAEEELAQAMTQGQQIMDKAKLEAERLKDKAAGRVAKQLARLEQLEAQLTPVKAAKPAGKNGQRQETQGATPESAPSKPTLSEREQRVLEALRAAAGPDGLSGGEWQVLTHLAKTTFARARTRLLADGLVETTGGPRSHVRYIPAAGTNSGIAPKKA
jgi:hypothetical protein